MVEHSDEQRAVSWSSSAGHRIGDPLVVIEFSRLGSRAVTVMPTDKAYAELRARDQEAGLALDRWWLEKECVRPVAVGLIRTVLLMG